MNPFADECFEYGWWALNTDLMFFGIFGREFMDIINVSTFKWVLDFNAWFKDVLSIFVQVEGMG